MAAPPATAVPGSLWRTARPSDPFSCPLRRTGSTSPTSYGSLLRLSPPGAPSLIDPSGASGLPSPQPAVPPSAVSSPALTSSSPDPNPGKRYEPRSRASIFPFFPGNRFLGLGFGLWMGLVERRVKGEAENARGTGGEERVRGACEGHRAQEEDRGALLFLQRSDRVWYRSLLCSSAFLN